MSDATTKLVADRIGAIIERVRVLAEERDACLNESEVLKTRIETSEREHARLRTVLSEAVRDLRQD
jgi:hypothetical protein